MTIFTGGPITRTDKDLSEFDIGTADAMNAYGADAWRHSPSSSIFRFFEQLRAESDEESPELSLDEQKKIIEEKQVPLKAEEGTNQATLSLLIERKQEELADKQAMQRASTAQAIAGFGAGFLTSILDPINVAVGLVPFVGPARYAGMLARQATAGGRASLRFRTGAVEGFIGSAVIEPIVALQARNEQSDYTMADTLMNLAFGTVLGGGLHAGIGHISDRVRTGRARTARKAERQQVADELARLTPAEREDLFRSNMALFVGDRGPVTPSSFKEALRGSTAISRVTGQELEVTVQTRVFQQPIEPDVEAVARAEAPEMFQRVDALKTHQSSIRGQIDILRGERGKSVEVRQIDEDISTLEIKRESANKRNKKRLTKEITALKQQRAALLKEDSPAMTRFRERLIAIDEELRDIAPAYNGAIQRAEVKTKNQAIRFGPPTTERQVSVASRSFGDEDVKRVTANIARIKSVENLRLANTEFTSKIDEEILPADAFDNIADAESGLAEQNSRLNEVLEGADAERVADYEAIRDAETEAVTADIEADAAYGRAVRMLAVCATSRG